MEYVPIAIMIISYCAFVISFWGLACNQWTCNDRVRLLGLIHAGREDWRTLSEDFRATDYDRHMYDRMLFRNPWKRYSYRLRSLLTPTPQKTPETV